MGKKHDDIVMSITNKFLYDNFVKINANKEVFAPHEDCFHKDSHEWSIKDVIRFFKFIEENDIKGKYTSLTFPKILKEVKEAREDVKSRENIEKVIIEKVFERPIIKGEGQYRTTKGFIDLFVRIKPYRNFPFSCNNFENINIAIEVKTKKDFDDVGSIIRQLNEYKEYFSFSENEIERGRWSAKEQMLWVVVCDEDIEEQKKNYLKESGYLFLCLKEEVFEKDEKGCN